MSDIDNRYTKRVFASNKGTQDLHINFDFQIRPKYSTK
jgi:hypothetical protein